VNFSTGSRYLGDLQPTAMSDIIFNLFIFFLLTSTFNVTTGIQLGLPEVVKPTSIDERRPVVVTLTSNDQLFVGDREVPWAEERRALEQALDAAGERTVVIKGDASVPLRRVVQVMDLARQLKAEGLAIAAQPQPEPDGKGR
jgi:biopolymer transport protein ExbD